MFEKLLGVVVAAKSGALSGVLIVAGAVVTVTAGGGLTDMAFDEPSPTPAIEEPADEMLLPDEESGQDDEDEDGTEPGDREERADPSPETCVEQVALRNDARQKVQAAFVKYHVELEHLRSAHAGPRVTDTLTKADAMLGEIAAKVDRALEEPGVCDEQVVERAVAAMETIHNLAKSAAETSEATPKPRPTEKPKATEKPKTVEKAKATPKATPKPARTPSCDDRLYENKKKMIAAFEKFHTNNDKLYYAIKRTASESTVKAVLVNDKLMHSTYESAKSEILSSGCAGDLGAAAAARAAATFERAWLSSAAAAGSDHR